LSLPGIEPRSPGHLVRSHIILSYPGSLNEEYTPIKYPENGEDTLPRLNFTECRERFLAFRRIRKVKSSNFVKETAYEVSGSRFSLVRANSETLY
jgi:hypothetical protein